MTAIETLLRQPAAQAVGWALLQFVWQGVAVGALTALALLALRRSASDVRYVVAAIGLALMLTLPVVSGVQKFQAPRADPDAPVQAPAASLASPDGPSRELSPASRAQASSDMPGRAARTPVLGLVPSVRVEPLLPTLILGWIIGVTMLSLRLLTGWIWVQRLCTHGATPAEDPWQRMATRLSRRMHIARAITLLESTLVDVPTVIGWLKPVVLLPASALGALSPQQLELILAHELAHIRRHDYLVNLLQTLVETLLFYHPAVWWLSRRIRIERENCCDDLAVSLCGDPVAYANALADLESLRPVASAWRKHEGHIAMAATGGALLQRVRRLLSASSSHTGRGPAWLAGSVALLLIGGIAVGADGLGRRDQASTQPATAPAKARLAQTTEATAATTPVVEPARAVAPLSPLSPLSNDEQRARDMAVIAATEARESGAAQERAVLAATEVNVAEAARAGTPAVAARASTAAAAATEPAVAPSGVAAASTAPVLAAVIPAADAPATTSQSMSHHQDGSSGNWIWSNNGEKLQVTYSGTFDFTDDDADIRQVSAGGYLKISDGAWFGRHSIEIRERGGQLERRYYVNGSERPYEPEGRAWLRDNLPKFVRNTGIAAPARVARFLKSGGVSAVIGEISRIDGTYVKGIYFKELFKQATLTPDQYRQAMVQASREMKGSDYELASMLIAIADRLPNDETSRDAYFTAASGISSDYELRRVYSTMLKRGPVSPQTLAGILAHSTTIDSDYELSELLRQIMAQQSLDDKNRAAFFKTVATISSGYERHRVLKAVIDRSPDAATVEAALTQAASMSSDYEAGTFLHEVLKQSGVEGSLRTPFFTVVSGLSSGHERGGVLQAVVKKPDVSADTLREVLKSTRGMSGYELSQLLILVAGSRTLTGDLRDAYLDAADTLSGYEQGQVMTALVKSERRK
jgi:beta-lactamase regulating signal transducer with metallopeptidase domain